MFRSDTEEQYAIDLNEVVRKEERPVSGGISRVMRTTASWNGRSTSSGVETEWVWKPDIWFGDKF